jgi:hypothetical protein
VPLIRLARDKRGLDTLYLLHHRQDGRGEPRLRVIYFCAAPQGLDFGRQALDPQTQRALEQRYPDVAFDWAALLKEIEQRRLPPQLEVPIRRPRPAAKAERRPPASETPIERPAAGKRKRRRGGQGQSSTAAGVHAGGAENAPITRPPSSPPIIE